MLPVMRLPSPLRLMLPPLDVMLLLLVMLPLVLEREMSPAPEVSLPVVMSSSAVSLIAGSVPEPALEVREPVSIPPFLLVRLILPSPELMLAVLMSSVLLRVILPPLDVMSSVVIVPA